jgi:DNA recombination protein RmuC
MEIALIICGIVIVALGTVCFRALRAVRVEREARISSEARLSHLQRCEIELAEQRREVVRLVQLSSELEGKSARLPNLERETTSLQARLVEATGEAAALRVALAEKEKAQAQEIAALTAIREDIANNLKILTADSLKDNQTSFLHLANEVFEKHREGATTELGERQKAFSALLEPIVTMLNAYQAKIAMVEKTQHEAYGALTAELKSVVATQNSVRAETAKLVTALRAAPKTRGLWGEHTLLNVIELSVLSSLCDFTT